MKLALVICTYKRSRAIKNLMSSVQVQSHYPDEIIVIDASPDDKTKDFFTSDKFVNLKYIKVQSKDRGLTKQRNLGVNSCSEETDIVAFLDDDIVLENNYFEYLLETYKLQPKAIAVGGYIKNESDWTLANNAKKHSDSHFCFDGYCKKDALRFRIRKYLGLAPDRPPCFLPKFSHGRSVGYLPPSGKTYNAEQLMGCSMSFKSNVFKSYQFSEYFEGYSLYEDAEFCFRILKSGQLYVNTSAKCEHHHHPSGRPNHFVYGKMVVRNGWYVWRLRWPNPGLKNIFKWHITCLFLLIVRFLNIFTSSQKKQAFTESFGRFTAWILLFFKKPNIKR